jgi:hypothetical protein
MPISDLIHPLAYIDGGSASLFFQALIAGILAAGFMAKSQIFMLWTKVKGVFVKKGSDER